MIAKSSLLSLFLENLKSDFLSQYSKTVIPTAKIAGTIMMLVRNSYGNLHERDATIMVAEAIIKANPVDVMNFADSFRRRTISEERAKGTRIIPTATVIAICDWAGSRTNP